MVWKVFTLRFCTTLIFSRMFLKYYRYRYKVNTKKLGTYAEHTIKFISSLYQSLFSNYHRKTEKRENRQSPLYTSLVASTCVAEPGSSLHRVVGTWTQLCFADTPHGAFIVSEIRTPFWFRFFSSFFRVFPTYFSSQRRYYRKKHTKWCTLIRRIQLCRFRVRMTYFHRAVPKKPLFFAFTSVPENAPPDRHAARAALIRGPKHS